MDTVNFKEHLYSILDSFKYPIIFISLCVFVLYVINFKYGFTFLLSSIIIIILYYLQMDRYRRKENFIQLDNPTPLGSVPIKTDKIPVRVSTYTPYNKSIEGTGLSVYKGQLEVKDNSVYRFAYDEVVNVNDPEYMSINQKLVGVQNPKTNIPPVIVPPSHDLSYWKANNLVTHSAINYSTQQDAYQSGFQVSSCSMGANRKEKYDNVNTLNPGDIIYEEPEYDTVTNEYEHPQIVYEKEDKEKPHHIDPPFDSGIQPIRQLDPPEQPQPLPIDIVDSILETYEQNDKHVNHRQYRKKLLPNYNGQVNTACGYNPSQIKKSGLPSNYPAGNCEQDPSMKEYNERMFTQIIEPGIYSYNQINEPINANMGISFTQQFEPTTIVKNKNGITFVEHDPRLDDYVIEAPETNDDIIGVSDVYDPRFYGYGTSYRSYLDKNIGQTRYMYDDVNAIRAPNYIVRSKIDNQKFADCYGRSQFENGDVMRSMVNEAFTNDAIEFRTGLQNSLMRKVNAEKWQQRQMPIRTSGQYMGGGMSRK